MSIFNYQLVNKVGGPVEISFEEFGRLERVTVDTDDILNWLRIFRSRTVPVFNLQAKSKQTGVPVKINGQDTFMLQTTNNRNQLIVVDITEQGW